LREFLEFLAKIFNNAGGDIFKSQLGLLLLLSDDLMRHFGDVVAWLKNSDVYKQVGDVVKSPDSEPQRCVCQ
jgi:hypothetical protein